VGLVACGGQRGGSLAPGQVTDQWKCSVQAGGAGRAEQLGDSAGRPALEGRQAREINPSSKRYQCIFQQNSSRAAATATLSALRRADIVLRT